MDSTIVSFFCSRAEKTREKPDYEESLLQADELVLITILSVKGSAPRHPGTSMLVFPDGSQLGTIGGGEGESIALNRARKALEEKSSFIVDFRMLGLDPTSTQAICGGISLMLVEYLNPSTSLCIFKETHTQESGIFSGLAQVMSEGRRVLLAKRLRIQDTTGSTDIETRFLVTQNSTLPESLNAPLVRKCLGAGQSVYDPVSGWFLDCIIPQEKLCIFGGGHVGLAIAQVAQNLGFVITVLDDRPGFDSGARFPPAVKTLTGSFSSLAQDYSFDESTYIIVATQGHLGDIECLRKILSRPYKYAGFIGSGRKTQMVLGQLKDEGFAEEKLMSLFAPVGLDIEAESPEEIAIAILAEIIACRHHAPMLATRENERKTRRMAKSL